MIIKPMEIPISLQKLRALYERTPNYLPQYVQISEQYRRSMAGYKGECSIDYPLSMLPEKTYLILHDLRLPVRNRFIQLDILLLSSNFFVILEVKNIAGKLVFDRDFHQLVRYKEMR